MANLNVTIRTPWSNTIEIPVQGVYFGYPKHEWTNIELDPEYESMAGLHEWLDVQTESHRATWQTEGGRDWDIQLSPEFEVKELE
ncbi:hypothetical protein SEA_PAULODIABOLI_309 [Microbacterium phage PauloDiaboli]|nr:hypothetical protein SEA_PAULODIABOLI_309 [Microbacterium phage PauloDiaboli]QWY84116.1 hypothetical protein SEA_A3WALLY_309 [Microbacterium phage A3Wally]